jgi:hypothetical protein
MDERVETGRSCRSCCRFTTPCRLRAQAMRAPRRSFPSVPDSSYDTGRVAGRARWHRGGARRHDRQAGRRRCRDQRRRGGARRHARRRSVDPARRAGPCSTVLEPLLERGRQVSPVGGRLLAFEHGAEHAAGLGAAPLVAERQPPIVSSSSAGLAQADKVSFRMSRTRSNPLAAAECGPCTRGTRKRTRRRQSASALPSWHRRSGSQWSRPDPWASPPDSRRRNHEAYTPSAEPDRIMHGDP